MPTSAVRSLRIAVFVSGRGSNFRAILDAKDQKELSVDVALLVSNKASAGALETAAQRNIPTHVHRRADFDTPEAYAQRLLAVLREAEINVIVLAGYLAMIPSEIVQVYRHRIINIHPSLLPAFGGKGMYGLNVHKAVLNYGARWTGVTVHFVDESYDTGPVIMQEPVRVEADDTPESLAARVLKTEHTLYPHVLRLFAEGRITLHGRHVHIHQDA